MAALDGAPTLTELRELLQEQRDQQPVVQTCLFCDWRYEGTVAAGRTAAREHREAMHPEAANRKRTYRKPGMGTWRRDHVDDELIEAQRRARLEREEAERLASIERGRRRREAEAAA